MSTETPSLHPLQFLLDLFRSLPDGWRLVFNAYQLFVVGPQLGDRRRNLLHRLTPVQRLLLDRLWDDIQGQEYRPTGFMAVEVESVELGRDGSVIVRWEVTKAVDYLPAQVPDQNLSHSPEPSPLDGSSTPAVRCPSCLHDGR